MNTTLKTLFWKEWQENLVNLVTGVVFLVAFRIMLKYLHIDKMGLSFNSWNIFAGISMIFCSVFALITAIGMFAMEYNHKTMNYLFTKPVNRWDILLAKVGIACMEFVTMAVVFLVLSFNQLSPSMNQAFLGKDFTGVMVSLVLFFVVLPWLFYSLGVLCSIWFKNMTQATMSAIVLGMIIMVVIMQLDAPYAVQSLGGAIVTTIVLMAGAFWMFQNPNRTSS